MGKWALIYISVSSQIANEAKDEVSELSDILSILWMTLTFDLDLLLGLPASLSISMSEDDVEVLDDLIAIRESNWFPLLLSLSDAELELT